MGIKSRLKKASDRYIDTLIIHCADTPPTMDIGVDEIRKWHVEDNGWKDVGYHYIIRRNGIIEIGRDINVIGSHCSGYNTNSIGICLVGGRKGKNKEELFTEEQYDSLESLIINLKALISLKIKIKGHRDFNSNKTCPNFDVADFLAQRGLDYNDEDYQT